MRALAGALGLPPMPWQAHVARVATEHDPATGEWAYPVVVVTVPRQSGKTALQLPGALQRGRLGVDRRCWYTAQTRQDARDMLVDVFQPAVRRSPLGPLTRPRKSNGSEGIWWRDNDSFLRVFAPGEDALHGKANDLVVVDEAWAFDPLAGQALEQAILPTFNTRPGQLWLISSAGTAASSWLRGYVERGRAAVEAGATDGLAYFEWGVPDGLPADDVDTVLAHHPAWGHTLRRQAVEAARAVMAEGEFARAYANRWTATTERIIDLETWMACLDPEQAYPGKGRAALGIAVALDRSTASISAAWEDGDQLRVELVDRRPGTAWVPARLLELAARWAPTVPVAYDGIGPAVDVAADAARAGVRVHSLTTREYVEACLRLVARASSRQLRHRGQADLDTALTNATARSLNDAWVWGRKASAGSIDALEAVTVAAHRAGTTRPPVMV